MASREQGTECIRRFSGFPLDAVVGTQPPLEAPGAGTPLVGGNVKIRKLPGSLC